MKRLESHCKNYKAAILPKEDKKPYHMEKFLTTGLKFIWKDFHLTQYFSLKGFAFCCFQAPFLIKYFVSDCSVLIPLCGIHRTLGERMDSNLARQQGSSWLSLWAAILKRNFSSVKHYFANLLGRYRKQGHRKVRQGTYGKITNRSRLLQILHVNQRGR